MPEDRGPPDATLSDPAISAVSEPTESMSPADRAAATTIRDKTVSVRPRSIVPGQRLGNRYLVKELLGQGGMGVVFRATDEKLREEVALKVVRDAAIVTRRLREEVRLAQRVSHRNVCRTYDLEEVDGYHLVKMEYVPGETLAQVVRRDGALPVARALAIARAIAAGLAAAHAEGIVHRDLKPENVMVSGDRIVLMDFGLAQRIVDPDGAKVGTPSYMAPEQVAGGAIDERTDLYALGCVVFELVTGARVFDATRPTDVMHKHEAIAPPALDSRLPRAPRWLVRAVALLLAKAPEDRPRGLALLLAGPPKWRRTIAVALLAAAALTGGIVIAHARASSSPGWTATVARLDPQFDEDGFVAISPDGTQLAYSSDREAPGARHRVFVAPMQGGDAGRALTPKELDANMPRWTRDGRAVLYTASGVLYRQPVAGGPPESLGASNGADDCGDAIAILRFSFAGSYLELRAADGTRRRLAALPGLPTYQQASAPRCSPTGDRVVFTAGASAPSACIHDVWIVGRDGSARQITRDHRACKAVFAPDGGSLVMSAKRDGKTLLYELPLDGRPERALTTYVGPDVNPDVAPHGPLVFQREVLASKLVVGDATSSSAIPIHVGVVDTVTPTRDFAYVIAQRDDPAGGAVLESIRVADGHEQTLAAGILPFVSFDGTRVLFRTIDRGEELRAVPLAGGADVVVARLPGTIALGAAGPDGAHVLIERDGALAGWRVAPDGTAVAEGVPGLVIPAPTGGWRMVQLPAAGATFRVQLVPPGAPLSAPSRELSVVSIYNSWIDDHRIAVARDGQFQIVDVTTGAVTVVASHAVVWPVSVLAADGVHWATIDRVRHVTRYAVTNFGDRPR